MAGADEENYLDNLLSSISEVEQNETSTNNENADTYNDDNSVSATSKETQKEDMSVDFSEPDLSESDLERLESMKLDSIIEQVTSDDISVDELLNDDISNTKTQTNNKAVNKTNVETVDKADNKDISTMDSKTKNNNDTNDIIDIIEDSLDNKGKKRKKKKKGLIAALKNIFFEDIDEEVKASVEGANANTDSSVAKKNKKDKKSKKEDKQIKKEKGADDVTDLEQEDKPVDENQQLLDEMYGDKDNLDENIAPKKGLFAKIKYRLEQYKQKSEEEEKLEEEAEIADQNEKKKLKEEKAKQKADKKEEAKKAKAEKPKKEKKPKAEKPKKEKKPKPAPKPGDILKIKPKSMILFVFFVAGVVVLIILFNSAFNYNKNVSEAKGYIESGNYARAYQKLAGLSLRKNDESLLRQVSVIMFVQRQTESYNNYMQLDMKDQALNSLVKGLKRYDEYYREADELGITSQLNSEKEKILGYFESTYNMSEEEANQLVELRERDFTSYYATLAKYRKAKS